MGSPRVSCSSDSCRWERVYFTEAEWLKIAPPPLAPEIVAVLECVNDWPEVDGFNETLWSAREDWIAAGRPGLPPETTKKEPK
jgi:hypothetical protein